MTLENAQLLTISEIFGQTLQGEGINQGKPCWFIRTGLCNLDCKWCDTPFTWDWTGKNGTVYDKATETKRMSVADICERIDHNCERIVISGGEPMLQQKNLLLLVSKLISFGHTVEIETNGTLLPSDDWTEIAKVQFNVSPKLFHSGVSKEKAIKVEALQKYNQLNAVFKFVVQGTECVNEIKEIIKQIKIDDRKIWLMPEGRTSEQVINNTPSVFAQCVENNWNMTTRLQVLAYNDQRGV
jgi:organic radical activating enzyme